eukprot:10491816-Ditylum_brightwellii.AAC.1
MLEFKISGMTVKDNILTSPYIVDIHKTIYTETKGIWTIELMVDNLHKVLVDVETSFEVLPEVLSKDYFSTYNAFSVPQVILTYGTAYRYTEQIMSNVLTITNENKKKFTTPPQNAWNHGPSKTPKQRDRSEQQQLNKTKHDNILTENYKQLKDSIEKSQKQQEETLK